MPGNDVAELTLEVEEGGANIEPGDTRQGVITGAETKEFTHDGDDITYYQLNIKDEEVEAFEFSPDWPARLTPSTGLGQLVSRFGVDLTIGEEVALHEVFEPGTEVEFEVTEEEGDEDTFTVVDETTVRPPGTDLDQESGDADEDSEEDGEDDVRSRVLELVDEEYEGDREADVKKELAKKDGELLKAFKSLVDDGDIETEEDDDGDEIVFLA